MLGNSVYCEYQSNGIHSETLSKTIGPKPVQKISFPELVLSEIDSGISSFNGHIANRWAVEVVKYVTTKTTHVQINILTTLINWDFIN